MTPNQFSEEFAKASRPPGTDGASIGEGTGRKPAPITKLPKSKIVQKKISAFDSKGVYVQNTHKSGQKSREYRPDVDGDWFNSPGSKPSKPIPYKTWETN